MQPSLFPTKDSQRRASVAHQALLLVGLVTLALFSILGLPGAPRWLWSNSSNPGSAAASNETPEEAARVLAAKIEALSQSDPGPSANFSPIVFTEFEANSYLKYRGREFLPPGVYEPEIHIHPDGISGAAEVDFNALNKASPKTDDWGAKLLVLMFTGRQRVSATGKVETGNGQGKVTIENVAVGATSIPDWLVNLLLDNYVQKRYNIDLSKPLILPAHLTRIELGPGRATLFRSPTKNQ